MRTRERFSNELARQRVVSLGVQLPRETPAALKTVSLSPDYAVRDWRIARLFIHSGMSCRMLGERFQTTGQRISQILRRVFHETELKSVLATGAIPRSYRKAEIN